MRRAASYIVFAFHGLDAPTQQAMPLKLLSDNGFMRFCALFFALDGFFFLRGKFRRCLGFPIGSLRFRHDCRSFCVHDKNSRLLPGKKISPIRESCPYAIEHKKSVSRSTCQRELWPSPVALCRRDKSHIDLQCTLTHRLHPEHRHILPVRTVGHRSEGNFDAIARR